MIRFRPFCNADPPGIVSIWQSRAEQPGVAQPVSVDLLEQFVFGKVCFGETGIFMALDEGRPVGFAHAAFGPSEDRNWISTDTGVICMLMVRPDTAEADVAGGLLEQCEAFLTGHGVKTIHGGAVREVSPFYLGLYGGAELPGVLDSDTVAQRLYGDNGYEIIDRTLIYRRNLSSFRPPVDRRQVQFRRQMIMEVIPDPLPADWWEACTAGDFELTRFELVPRGSGAAVASVTVRDMGTTSTSRRGRVAGLMHVQVNKAHRREGLATHLLYEVFRQLSQQGVIQVEGHASEKNTLAMSLYEKLGLVQSEQAAVFLKRLTDD